MLNLKQDALEFGKLSENYRKAKTSGNSAMAEKYQKDIKNLVGFTAERLAMVTKTKLVRKQSGLDTGKGCPLVSLSINKIISKGSELKLKDLATLNTRQDKQLTGVNFIIDYSGSMWFDGRDTISGLKRIAGATFLALVYGVYLAKVSKQKLMMVYTVFSKTPVHLITNNILSEDWDLLLPTEVWGMNYGLNSPLGLQSAPGVTDKNEMNNWFCNVYPAEAINESNAQFKEHNLSKFITILLTDGGMHRIGESSADREAFLSKSFISTKSSNRLSFVMIIKQQDPWFNLMLNKLGIKYAQMNDEGTYNGAFEYLTSLVNQFNKGGK